MMRLICPNCSAQYDVADDAIPPGGRDVQCSNCQLSWFQTEKPAVPGREALQLDTPRAPETAEDPPAPDEAPVEETSTEAPTPEPETAASEPDRAEPEPEAAEAPEAEPAPQPTPQPQRKPLDDAVANILREEAAVSGAAAAGAATAAAASASPAEKPASSSAISKPPATEAARSAKPVTADETRQRIAMMTAEEGGTKSGAGQAKASAAPTPSASADEAHLRTVPSINEINATLRARAQANDTSGLTEEEKQQAVQRKGFRRGFFWVLILLAILILPYVFADQIIENLPQTTGIMASYVTMVDQLRVALSDMVSGLTAE